MAKPGKGGSMKYDLIGQIEAIVKDGVRRLLSGCMGGVRIKQSEFWRVLDDLGILIPALKRPALKELRKQFSWIKSIKRNTSPTEAVMLRLGTVLRENEDYVGGSEYERRLAPRQNLVLGYQQAFWLVEHQDEFPAFKALLGKNYYIDFPGLIVALAGGHRYFYFPSLVVGGARWCLVWRWTSKNLYRRGRVASK